MYERTKQHTLICQHCHEPFTSFRSDAKYCSNSCKTLACDKRRSEKRNQRLADEEYQRQCRIKQKEKYTAIAQTIPPKPPNNFSNQNYVDEQNSVNEFLEKLKQDQKLYNEKREFEKQWKPFCEIADRFLFFSKLGYIRRSEILLLWDKVDRVIDDEIKIKKYASLHKHWHFIDDVFSVYLNELEEAEEENDSRRLEFEAPDEIISGLQMLMKPISFPSETDSATK